MITKIGFKNIRVFEELTEFELKPFTILTGANNTGKSALQKMLLLLSKGFEINNNQLQVENLLFDKSIINKTGDFKSNLNYNSEHNEISITIGFEDMLFGKLDACLVYKGGESGSIAELVKISLLDRGEKLLSLNKEEIKGADKIVNGQFYHNDDWIWNWDIISNDSLDSGYFEKLYESLLSLRKEGENQFLLQEVAKDLEKNKGNIDTLSVNRKKTYDLFKKRGIIAYDERAVEYYDNTYSGRNGWKVWDENTNDIYIVDKKAYGVFKDFPFDIEGGEFLIYSDVLKTIGSNFNEFLSNEGTDSSNLGVFLVDNGVDSSIKFKEKYKEFEIFCLQEFFMATCYSTFDEEFDIDEGYSTYRSKKFNKILDISNSRFNAKKFLNENFDVIDLPKGNLTLKDSIIAKCLVKFYNYKIEPLSGRSIPREIIDQILNRSEGLIKEYKEKGEKSEIAILDRSLGKIQYYFLNPFQTFLHKFKTFTSKTSVITHNNIIKRNYMFEDVEIMNSPFFKFGIEFSLNKSDMSKLTYINKWLKDFEIASELKVHSITLSDDLSGQAIGYYYSLMINGREVPLSDCGSGIKQIVSLLLEISLTPPESIILLEEPEIKMHPGLQSKLALLFVDANKEYGISFIIETHSEYLIRKFQHITAQKEIRPDQTGIYYFNSDENLEESKIKLIEIDKTGKLTDAFGSGFYDEADNMALDLFLLNQKK